MYLMDLFQGWESKGLLKLHLIFFWGGGGGGGGLMLGDSNAEKWGDHQNKKFFIDNFVKSIKVNGGCDGRLFL